MDKARERQRFLELIENGVPADQAQRIAAAEAAESRYAEAEWQSDADDICRPAFSNEGSD